MQCSYLIALFKRNALKRDGQDGQLLPERLAKDLLLTIRDAGSDCFYASFNLTYSFHYFCSFLNNQACFLVQQNEQM